MEETKLSPDIYALNEMLDLDNSRFSKYISDNITQFNDYSNESLALDITAYIFEISQKCYTDAWFYYEFDYTKFCKIFNYSPDYLFKHFLKSDSLDYINKKEVSEHKVPYIVQREKNIDIDLIFDKSTKIDKSTNHNAAFTTTILGNVFYELCYRSFITPHNNILKYKDGTINELHVKDLNILEEFIAQYHRNRKDKTIVKFKPNKILLYNNFKAFFNINLNTFKDLSLSQKRLHIYLSNEVNNLKRKSTNLLFLPVNLGCQVAEIKPTASKDTKKNLKNILKSLSSKTKNDEEKFILKPDRKLTTDSKNNYCIVLEFPNLKGNDTVQHRAIIKASYEDYYRKALHEAYIKYHLTFNNGDTNKLTLEEWINSSVDTEHKISAYIEAQTVIFNNKLSRNSFEVLKEFTPEISISPEEMRDKLLNDPLLEIFTKAYSIGTRYGKTNIKPIPHEELNKDRFLCQSIEIFLKAYSKVYVSLAYAKEESIFFAILKDPEELLPTFHTTK